MDATAANPWLVTAIVVGSGIALYLILAGVYYFAPGLPEG